MSQGSSVTSGLVRVTIASGSRRVDLVLPGSIPVAELVPELARSVGLLDASTVYGGYRLVTQEGRVLANNAGLTMQGIEDGGLLMVSAGVDDPAPRVYDDVVEAMADVVENELKPWEPAAGRRTALGAGSILLGLGALALLLQGESLLGGVVAAVIAALLVVGGVVLDRAQQEPEAGVAVSLLAALYAAVAGLLLAPGDLPAWAWPLEEEFFTQPMLFAGLGTLAVGLVAVVGLQRGRALVIPAIVVGAVLLASALLIRVTSFEPGAVLTVLLTLVVLAGSVFPWLALGVTGTKVDQLYSLHDITADPEDIDPDEVADDARVGHEILLAVSATVGTLLVLLAPFAVDRGVAGTVLAAVCCLAVMFRTRQYRTGSEVLAGLTSGILGLVSVAVSMLLIHDGWRAGAAIGLAGIGAVLLALTLVPASASVRRGRMGDVVETLTLLALLPLMVLAAGLVSAVAG
ncbi:type VII secretion integral membrane protein EccD [Nocardioides okcheonensis]|uniref:type VII secretion integral membrane protein EccD n=1 Tax=Nocardioides okcheonensis TaxID=2894081 RepID=UPI001E2B550B|nr:type VII secretion integral membrane protein EccD [Nocardioides okcheonensis]UFN43257.1 type VII secretion integral membrane protein EccD [Nocardioides okcheonensis]